MTAQMKLLAALACHLGCGAALAAAPSQAQNFFSESPCEDVDVARVGIFGGVGSFSVLATESRRSSSSASSFEKTPTAQTTLGGGAACRSLSDRAACTAVVGTGQAKTPTLFSAGKPDGSDDDFSADVAPSDLLAGSGEVWWNAGTDPVSSFPRQVVTVLAIKFPAPVPADNPFMWRGTQLIINYLKVTSSASFEVTLSISRTSDARLAMSGFRDTDRAMRWWDVGTQSVGRRTHQSSGSGSSSSSSGSGFSSSGSSSSSSSSSTSQTLRFDIPEDAFFSPELLEAGATQEPQYWAIRIYSSRERAAVYDSVAINYDSVELVQRRLALPTQQPFLSDSSLRAYVIREDGWQSPGAAMHFDKAAGGAAEIVTGDFTSLRIAVKLRGSVCRPANNDTAARNAAAAEALDEVEESRTDGSRSASPLFTDRTVFELYGNGMVVLNPPNCDGLGPFKNHRSNEAATKVILGMPDLTLGTAAAGSAHHRFQQDRIFYSRVSSVSIQTPSTSAAAPGPNAVLKVCFSAADVDTFAGANMSMNASGSSRPAKLNPNCATLKLSLEHKVQGSSRPSRTLLDVSGATFGPPRDHNQPAGPLLQLHHTAATNNSRFVYWPGGAALRADGLPKLLCPTSPWQIDLPDGPGAIAVAYDVPGHTDLTVSFGSKTGEPVPGNAMNLPWHAIKGSSGVSQSANKPVKPNITQSGMSKPKPNSTNLSWHGVGENSSDHSNRSNSSATFRPGGYDDLKHNSKQPRAPAAAAAAKHSPEPQKRYQSSGMTTSDAPNPIKHKNPFFGMSGGTLTSGDEGGTVYV